MMVAILRALGMFVTDMFKSRWHLEAENLFLRHQLNITLRQAAPRLRLFGSGRALVVWMTRLWPTPLGLAQVVQPETILRWHRKGFKAFWRWKSQNRVGRLKIDRGLRDLIQPMSRDNPLWGAARSHGSNLEDISAESRRGNCRSRICVLCRPCHGRRQLISIEVTRRPTAEWLARQITESFPWTSTPAYFFASESNTRRTRNRSAWVVDGETRSFAADGPVIFVSSERGDVRKVKPLHGK
jgi:hypothetical protein